jgi:HAD superfamily hydrolase (TIGR01509 family)
MVIKALIFDFDGLILDTELPDVEVWRTIYAEHGLEYPLENWSQIVGGWGMTSFDPATHLQRLTGTPLDVDAVRRRHRQESDALILRQPVMDGVQDYIKAAGRLSLRLAIASSSERAWVVPHLKRLGLLGHFEKVVCGDDVEQGRTKPHPDVFLRAVSELQIRPEEGLVLEDSPNGVKAARAAGLRVVAVPNPLTRLLPMDGANLVLSSMADMPLEEVLRRLTDVGHADRSPSSANPLPAS